MERLFDADGVNSQFIHAMVTEDYEKNMIDYIMQKRIMNGSVPSSLDMPKLRVIEEKTAALQDVFYKGDPLTPFEEDLQRIYMQNKLQKYTKFEKRRVMRFKVVWTVSDLNRYQDQINYRMSDPEYFGTSKPEFHPFDLDNAIKCMAIHQEIQKTSSLRKAFSYFTDTKVMERGQRRSIL
jgi:hypothetical protein